jgi:hypothetical protein
MVMRYSRKVENVVQVLNWEPTESRSLKWDAVASQKQRLGLKADAASAGARRLSTKTNPRGTELSEPHVAEITVQELQPSKVLDKD